MEIRWNADGGSKLNGQSMKPKLVLGLALVLSGTPNELNKANRKFYER